MDYIFWYYEGIRNSQSVCITESQEGRVNGNTDSGFRHSWGPNQVLPLICWLFNYGSFAELLGTSVSSLIKWTS